MLKQRITLPLIAMSLIAMTAAGCGKGNGKNVQIDGVKGPDFNIIYADGKPSMASLSMKFLNMNVDGGLRIQIPHTDNSYLELGPDFETNGTLLALYLDLKDMKFLSNNGLQFLDPKTLPGGRPLPGVSSGTMPAVALEIQKLLDMTVYVGPKAIGLFIPVRLGNNNAILTFRFYDTKGNSVGNLSLVGADSEGKHDGIFILFPFSNSMKNMI